MKGHRSRKRFACLILHKVGPKVDIKIFPFKKSRLCWAKIYLLYIGINLLHTRTLQVLCIQHYLRNITGFLKLVWSACKPYHFCINTEKVVEQQHALAFTGGKYCTFSLKQITELHVCWDVFWGGFLRRSWKNSDGGRAFRERVNKQTFSSTRCL